MSEWPAQSSMWAKSFELFCQSVFKIYCPLEIFGKENLPQVPFLICSNHASHLDSSMLTIAAGHGVKNTGLIAAKDYFFDQSHRFFLHYMMNLVPIARGKGARAMEESIVACRSFLNSGGQVLIIYPEGTRSRTGQMTNFKQGASILSAELDIPMVPAFVRGSKQALPKGAYMIRPKKLSVFFGEPLKVSDYLVDEHKNDRRKKFQAYRQATIVLEERVRMLAKKAQLDA